MPTVLPHDLRVIERQAAELGDCRLIVFDPISAYLGGAEVGRGTDLRRVSAPLSDMARRLGAAVVLVTHHNKRGASGTNGKYRVLGSIAYVGACRGERPVPQGPRRPERPEGADARQWRQPVPSQPALAYVIRDEGAGPFCDWLPETIELGCRRRCWTVPSRPAGPAHPAGSPAATNARCGCGGISPGERSQRRNASAAALAAGFTRSVLLGARIALAVRCLRSGFGKGACYHWSLPEAASESSERPDLIAGAHASELS